MATVDQNRFGEVLPDGTHREPTVSVLSGKGLEPGDVRIQLSPDSRYFVRVKAWEWRRLNEVNRAAMREEWLHQVPASGPVVAAPETVALEDMSMDALKSLANDRGVDLAGRQGSKQSIVNALRAAEVQAMFTGPAKAAGESNGVTDGN